MADRKEHVCRLILSALVMTYGLTSAVHGLPTSTHRLPTSSPDLPTSSTTDRRQQKNLQRTHNEDSMTRRQPVPPTSHHAQSNNSVSEADAKMAEELLRKYGYFRQGMPLHLQPELPDAGGHSRTERDTGHVKAPLTDPTRKQQAIRVFQSFFGLAPTGQLDQATLSLMKQDRCGVPDILEDETEQKPHDLAANRQSPSDYSLLGTKWDSTTLTWRLKVPSNQLHRDEQRRTIEDAFATWTQVAPLKFEEKRTRGPVDITIEFGTGQHGDEYPFDGKGQVLAHAFGPGETPISGDMHLDNDETWTVGSESASSDLLLVSTHELGHSLGLSHSRDPASIMYPYYGLTDILGQDDIKAIQSLYGKRINKPPVTRRPRWRRSTTPTPTSKPVTRFPWAKSATNADRSYPRKKPEPGCDVKFDVVFQDDAKNRDVYTGIQGDLVYRFDQTGLLGGYPSSLSSVYPGAPSKADAVFGLAEKSATYFIKGNKVWRFFESRLDSAYPKDLNPSHFQETNRFALSVVDSSGIHRVFVFGRTRWQEYDFDNLPSYTPHAYPIPQYWPDIATDVIYAVRGRDGNIYLISPNSHVVLDSFRRAMYGGKQEGLPKWLQPACYMAQASTGSSSRHSFGSACIWAVFSIFLVVLRKC